MKDSSEIYPGGIERPTVRDLPSGKTQGINFRIPKKIVFWRNKICGIPKLFRYFDPNLEIFQRII